MRLRPPQFCCSPSGQPVNEGPRRSCCHSTSPSRTIRPTRRSPIAAQAGGARLRRRSPTRRQAISFYFAPLGNLALLLRQLSLLEGLDPSQPSDGGAQPCSRAEKLTPLRLEASLLTIKPGKVQPCWQHSCIVPATSAARGRRSRRSSSPHDAIIKLSVTCICGSNLWPYRGLQPIDGRLAHGMGPEYCGVVVEVRQRGSVGAARAVHRPARSVISDNTCPHCRFGFHSSCVQREFMIGRASPYARVPLADSTLVATAEHPSRRSHCRPARRSPTCLAPAGMPPMPPTFARDRPQS